MVFLYHKLNSLILKTIEKSNAHLRKVHTVLNMRHTIIVSTLVSF